MIIGTYFDGDIDDKLKMLQHGCYYDMICDWITKAGALRLRYRTLPEWAEVTHAWEHFRDSGSSFDHRCIQMGYDLIAARFRMVSLDMALTDDEKEDAWYAFFKYESAAWLANDAFLRCFMVAISSRRSSDGYAAEDIMFEMMRNQYTELIYKVTL